MYSAFFPVYEFQYHLEENVDGRDRLGCSPYKELDAIDDILKLILWLMNVLYHPIKYLILKLRSWLNFQIIPICD